MWAWEVERKVDLANGLVLAVLVDNGEVPSGTLGKFVEVLVGTGLHQRDAVDLHTLRFCLGAKFTRPGVRAAGHAIGHKAEICGGGLIPRAISIPLSQEVPDERGAFLTMRPESDSCWGEAFIQRARCPIPSGPQPPPAFFHR